MRELCSIGVSAAGGGQKRIAVAAIAAAGGHVLTSLQGVKAAALHMGPDVGAAVLTGARRCCHRDKASASIAEVIFKNCFILFFPLVQVRKTEVGCRERQRHRHDKEREGFLPWPLPRIEMHRVADILKYDHHSNWRHDSHADDPPCSNRPQRGSATRRAYTSSDKLRVILPHQVVLPTPLKGRIARTRWPDPVGVRDAG